MHMTPRQRWLALLNRQQTDRVPTDYQATPEVTQRLQAELGCPDEKSLWKRLHVDRRMFYEPVWKQSRNLGEDETDPWGIRYRNVNYGGGAYDEPVYHPLAEASTPSDVHAHPWPDPDDLEYDVITKAVEVDDGFWPVHSCCYEPFLLYGYLRGLEQSLVDLALYPDIADAVLGHLFDFHYEVARRSFEAGRGRIDLTWVAEDLGSQSGPLFSLGAYRRFLLPNQIRMADLARSHSVHVMYHTDGASRTFLPDLIDRVGIEILNPIQWRCPGMEREKLVTEFGDQVIFHGSIDNQQTLSFGSVEDVVAEVRESVEIYRNARWICAPCHNIQPVTPTENILAMYATIQELGMTA